MRHLELNSTKSLDVIPVPLDIANIKCALITLVDVGDFLQSIQNHFVT